MELWKGLLKTNQSWHSQHVFINTGTLPIRTIQFLGNLWHVVKSLLLYLVVPHSKCVGGGALRWTHSKLIRLHCIQLLIHCNRSDHPIPPETLYAREINPWLYHALKNTPSDLPKWGINFLIDTSKLSLFNTKHSNSKEESILYQGLKISKQLVNLLNNLQGSMKTMYCVNRHCPSM